ncbi:MAG: DUF362 domain-containing protein [bacterium]|nr:DUF362 domain-containing protein [bacterium]
MKVEAKRGERGVAEVLFASVRVERLEPELTLPAKFERMLKEFELAKGVKGKQVGIKMHFGGGTGYTTIPPVFVRILVEELKKAGAGRIKVMDDNPASGIARGYTREVLGCEVVSCFGASGRYVYREEIGYQTVDEALFGGEAVDCEYFIDLAHVKGHGDCGFGGSIKNIAMGVVPGDTRGKLHRLEGGIVYDEGRCTRCGKCVKECRNNAISFTEGKRVEIFFHHCTYCQHCVLICPEGALRMEGRRYEDFVHGMALVTDKFLERFKAEQLLFINVLLNITIFCDCWGMSTAALVPDIGIMASRDICAVEMASLDAIKTEKLLVEGLPKGRELREGGHLFERIHGKDPYLMVRRLSELRGGSLEYRLREIT